jgi:hypothetical protein
LYYGLVQFIDVREVAASRLLVLAQEVDQVLAEWNRLGVGRAEKVLIHLLHNVNGLLEKLFPGGGKAEGFGPGVAVVFLAGEIAFLLLDYRRKEHLAGQQGKVQLRDFKKALPERITPPFGVLNESQFGQYGFDGHRPDGLKGNLPAIGQKSR